MHTHELAITGYVQNVGFRAYVSQTARANGVKGETWNGQDRSVHVIAQHEDEAVLTRFEEEMWRGPGRVDGVRVEATEKPAYDWFEVKGTR
jgi:acylphosphatase